VALSATPLFRTASLHGARPNDDSWCERACAQTSEHCSPKLSKHRVEKLHMPAHVELSDPGQLIASLASKASMPIADVAALYARECAELATTANLGKFVQIFALRNVQEVLRARSREPAPPQGSTAHLPDRQDGLAFAMA